MVPNGCHILWLDERIVIIYISVIFHEIHQSSNFTFQYIDDVLQLSNSIDHLHLIYQSELEIKDTTESSTFTSYLDKLTTKEVCL